MSKKVEFINYIKNFINEDEMPDEVRAYWDAFQQTNDKEKPEISDNGKPLLMFLQTHDERSSYTAKQIADELGISSRSVSGSIRKLVTDGFVEKLGESPCAYAVTEKGKSYIFEN